MENNENKIEIKNNTTVEELTEIVMNNEPEKFIKAFHDYMMKQVDNWYVQYDRANKAEKELASIKDVLIKYALKQMEQ